MHLITVQTAIDASLNHVWACWTEENHITQWNFASDDWCCPAARVDLRVGGEFHYEMAAKDGSMSFDFWGTYTKIEPQKTLEIAIGDGRNMYVSFHEDAAGTTVIEQFEPENENPEDMQQEGWQMILTNFKKHAERK
jgi:uncharacterized protein YndB with AHSA1/START domain